MVNVLDVELIFTKTLTLPYLVANRSSTTYHEDQPILVKTTYINIRPLDG